MKPTYKFLHKILQYGEYSYKSYRKYIKWKKKKVKYDDNFQISTVWYEYIQYIV